MKNIKEGHRREPIKTDKPKKKESLGLNVQHEADLVFSKEIGTLDAFIEVPLLYFLDSEFNNCYYRLTKYFKVNNPKNQSI